MEGITRIDKVVALLDVWLDAELFPIPKMKVKVLARNTGDFLAVTNIHRRNITSREPEYLSGLGDTIDTAINDLLTRFVADIQENLPSAGLVNDDFEWSSPEDF